MQLILRKLFVILTISISTFILLMCIAGLISFILYKIGLYDITAIKMTLIAAIFPAGVISAFVMSVCIDYYKNTYIIYRKE